MQRFGSLFAPQARSVRQQLTQIYGIGRTKAVEICDQMGLSLNVKVNQLSNNQVSQILKIVNQNHLVDSELRASVQNDKKRLIRISCYRGMRHNWGLPLRGQRTHTNAKTSRKFAMKPRLAAARGDAKTKKTTKKKK